jgi:hypothetical protein
VRKYPTNRPLVDNDPFWEEAALHGDDVARMEHGEIRERIRERTDCKRCAALTEAFDAEMSRALINGTGPFGFG